MVSVVRSVKTQIALLAATLLVLIIDISLRYKGYRWTSRWLLRTSPTPDASLNDVLVAWQTARLIDRAARRVNASCLRRSLALWWWLRWKGLPSELRIGMNKIDGHAWIVHHNVVINDSADVAQKFVELDPTMLSPNQMARL
ncbi:MAG: hypothetical protein CUN55_17205 [Phototrophicales bacterium]|nr:MAG: hypothetical protein CUN55_17205 [Phototrophicales bacterium]